MMNRLVAYLRADIWRALFLALALVAAGKLVWDFYWWEQWLRQVSWGHQQVVKYLEEPIGQTPEGKAFNRRMVLDALIGQAAKQASAPAAQPVPKP